MNWFGFNKRGGKKLKESENRQCEAKGDKKSLNPEGQ